MKIFLFTLIALVACTSRTAAPDSSTEKLESETELYTGKEYNNAFANPKDSDLPNVLLIGDSISIGYTVEVRKLLKGKADVFRIPGNGKFSAYGERNLDKWLGRRQWHVIHFNWGLWDICYRDPKSKNQGHRDKVNGTLTATPKQYKDSMEKIIIRLKKTKAKLIWCETTPVPELEVGRKVGDAIKYNKIVEEMMTTNKVAINKLHAHAMLKTPGIFTGKGNVHFNAIGNKHLAKKVSQVIFKSLN
jgi:hypothetical protein